MSGDYVMSVLDIRQLIDKLNDLPGTYNPPGRNATAPHSVDAQAIQNFLALATADYGEITIDEVHVRAHGGDDVVQVLHASAWVFGGSGKKA